MRHHHTALPLAGYTIQQIDFDPATFQPEDLFWLPYHASLTEWGASGRRSTRPDASPRHTPCARWGETASRHRRSAPAAVPTPRFGSISHCGQRALAVIADRPVGVDIERRFTPQLAAELESSIISPAEKRRCCAAARPTAGADAGVFGKREWV